MTTTDHEFDIGIVPRKVAHGPEQLKTVYDIRVVDARNGDLLLFSNQGYENRKFARDLVIRLFAGKNGLLTVFGSVYETAEAVDLATM